MYPVNIIENLNGLNTAMFPDDFDFDAWLKTQSGIFDWYMMQELENTVAYATNAALALGRNVAPQTYSSYTPGAGWSDAGSDIAHSDGLTLASNFSVAVGLRISATYTVTFTISNYVGGTVRVRIGSGGVGSNRSGNGEYIENIVATGSENIRLENTANFEGDIDLKLFTIEQLNVEVDTEFPGVEETTNGDFASGDLTGWSNLGTPPTREVVGDRLHVISDAGSQGVNQVLSLTPGKRYKATIDYQVSGASLRFDDTGGGFSKNYANATGIDAFEFTAVTSGAIRLISTAGSVEFYVNRVSITEVSPMNGKYSGVILGNAADGNLGVAPSFDGNNDYLDIYSPEINSKFSPEAGTIVAFANVSAGTWAGATGYVIVIGADATNIVYIRKASSTIHAFYGTSTGNGAVSWVNDGRTGYLMIAMTWNTTTDQIELFIDGVSVGTSSTLGAWVGNLSSTQAVIGALDTAPANVWDGSITRVGLGWNTVLTPAQILDIYTKAGI